MPDVTPPTIPESAWAQGVSVERGGEVRSLYKPHPHQVKFHASTAKYCLMSGGAGSGKSLAMRWDAYIRCLTVPRFRALILRRTMPELRKSHLAEVPFDAEALGLGTAAWHSTHYILRFPNGSQVEFGHCEDEKTISTYLSSEYDAIYFDELCTFSLNQFLFIASRARSTKPGLQGKEVIRAGTNPIGVGASWVRRFFILKTVHESEIPGYRPEDYENIHCTVKDNPSLGEDYVRQLNTLPTDALRKAMLHGEWVIEGQFFSEWAPTRSGMPWHVIESLPRWRGRPIIEAPHIDIVRAVDWGYSRAGNPGVCLWLAILPDHSAIAFHEFVWWELLPAAAAAAIQEQSKGMRIRYTVGDPAMWQEHTGPSVAEKFAEAGLSMIEGDHAREAGWIAVHSWLRETRSDGMAIWPRLRCLRDGVPNLIRTLPDMVVDPRNPADMLTSGVEDDACDALRMFCMSRPGASNPPPPNVDPMILEMLKRAKVKGRATDVWAPNVL